MLDTTHKHKPQLLKHIMQVDEFLLPDGERCARVIMDVCEHIVQVLQYGESPVLTVVVDDDAEQVHINALDKYLDDICK